MEGDNIIKRKCQNPACGREFTIKLPAKPGKYGVNCPHCKAVNFFNVALPEGPAPRSAPPETRASSKPSPRPIAATPAREPADAPVIASVATPAKSPAKAPAQTHAAPQPARTASSGRDSAGARHFLVMSTGAWWWKKTRVLEVGALTVGAKSKKEKSDFMIADRTMSPQSALITVERAGSTVHTRLKVLNALNPVYLNNIPVEKGETVTLMPGDHLILGSTIFHFD